MSLLRQAAEKYYFKNFQEQSIIDDKVDVF